MKEFNLGRVKGDALKFEDLTAAQKEALRGPQGAQGIQGVKGDKGDQGAVQYMFNNSPRERIDICRYKVEASPSGSYWSGNTFTYQLPSYFDITKEWFFKIYPADAYSHKVLTDKLSTRMVEYDKTARKIKLEFKDKDFLRFGIVVECMEI